MRYIVKICPSCKNYNVFGLPKEGCCYHYMDYCKNYSNCLLKQIAGECKEEIEILPEIQRGDLAERIFSLLEIEEINE